MAGDERRAEIEAVARALTDWPDEWDEHDEGDKDVFRRMAADGIVALDRVRDARGDDEALLEATKREAACGRELAAAHAAFRAALARHEAAAELEDQRRTFFAPHSGHAVEAARSPQGEVVETVLGPLKVLPECKAQAVCVNGLKCWEAGRCLRSPQGEDHEESLNDERRP